DEMKKLQDPSACKTQAHHDVNCCCTCGNDAASEVLTGASQWLVENFFQIPSLSGVWVWPSAFENFWKGYLRGI
ncbi:unnamed protein product, partial [Dovyalis caffra]